jgi:hypothetical protein
LSRIDRYFSTILVIALSSCLSAFSGSSDITSVAVPRHTASLVRASQMSMIRQPFR